MVEHVVLIRRVFLLSLTPGVSKLFWRFSPSFCWLYLSHFVISFFSLPHREREETVLGGENTKHKTHHVDEAVLTAITKDKDASVATTIPRMSRPFSKRSPTEPSTKRVFGRKLGRKRGRDSVQFTIEHILGWFTLFVLYKMVLCSSVFAGVCEHP